MGHLDNIWACGSYLLSFVSTLIIFLGSASIMILWRSYNFYYYVFATKVIWVNRLIKGLLYESLYHKYFI